MSTTLSDARTAPPLLTLSRPRAILRLAWPTTASLMVVNLFNLVDAFWVGRLGTEALGGMTASAYFVWCAHSFGMLVGTGVNALVARRVGEGQYQAAGIAGGHGLVLSLALAAVAMVVGFDLQHDFFAAMGLSARTQQAAAAYFTPILYGMPALTGWYALEAIFRGYGDTKTPMWALSLSLLFNAALDPLLIFGVGSWRGLGIAGAGWATVFAHALAFFACWVLIVRRPVRPRLGGGGIRRLDLSLLGRIVGVGAPIAANAFLFSLIYVYLTQIIARFGSAGVAAVGVGHRVQALGYYLCVGFGVSASTLVGQNLGARRIQAAERAAWHATGYAAALMTLICVSIFLFAEPIMGLFATDAGFVAQGASYLRIVALLEVAMAFEVVLEGAFAGAGNSLPPVLISVPLTAARIPAAYLLAISWGWGLSGVWWAISVSTAIKGALIAFWFRRGRWKGAQL